MKTKKNFSPIVSHYKSFFADTFLKFISKNRNIENSFYLNKSKKQIHVSTLSISSWTDLTKFSEKIKNSIDIDSRANYVNDLEWALINDYPELQHIKAKYPTAIMTGSGSTYFSLDTSFEQEEGYWVKNGLETTEFGVAVVD